ncbi:hypothetical protein [Halobacillus salinus]|uniref:hypothetical protein n=1 Tax=Halobacillus salinus TaxID=192814 RepID=UPI001592354F|nr:hypothetical protein [Halobacillus salinus]
MKQTPGKWRHTYTVTVNETETYYIEADRRIGFGQRKIDLYDAHGDTVATIAETSKSTAFLEKIPVIQWFLKTTYTCRSQGERIGSIRVKNSLIQDKLSLQSDDHHLLAYYHTGGRKEDRVSVFESDRQVGMVTKRKKVKWGAHEYIAEFRQGTDWLSAVMVMAITDIAWNNTEIPLNETVQRSGTEAYWGLDRLFGKKPDLSWGPAIRRMNVKEHKNRR